MIKEINYNQNPIILNDFLLYLDTVKNYSLKTIRSYESDLKCFFKYIIEYKVLSIEYIDLLIFHVLQVEEADIISFLVYCNYYNNNCSYTRNRKLYAIRAFYKWLLNTNLQIQKENPTNNIVSAEQSLRLPKHLTLDQAKQIQCIFTSKNSKTPLKNNTIIALFLSTGMRVSELVSININDVNFKDSSIKIKGKGNKQRTVYFNKYSKKLLEEYIDMRKRDKDYNEALFINLYNQRIGVAGVELICNKAYKLMGLDNNGYTTHTLRHTAATLLYQYSSQDILLVKEFLGHSSIISTEIYTHVYNEEVKNAVEKNPLANFIK